MFGRRAGTGGATALAEHPRGSQDPTPEIIVKKANSTAAPRVREMQAPNFNAPLPFETAAQPPITSAAATAAQPAVPSSVEGIKRRIQPILMKRLDLSVAAALPRNELQVQITEVVSEILAEERINQDLGLLSNRQGDDVIFVHVYLGFHLREIGDDQDDVLLKLRTKCDLSLLLVQFADRSRHWRVDRGLG